MYKRRQISRILSAVVIALGVLFFILLVDGLVFCGMKYVFHLDFSQDYRQVEAVDQIRFWDSWSGKVYERYAFGLRPIGKQESIPAAEEPTLSPDGRYLLFCEIEYGVNGGYSTDEEYCYYRVTDLRSGTRYTIYSGYREWFQVYWEE